MATTTKNAAGSTCNRATLRRLCSRIMQAETLPETIAVLERFANRLPGKRKRGTWGYNAAKLLQAFKRDTVAFTIFAKGNGKLPFYAFSTLPEYTCPGAGDCLKWCYSFRAWRYPAAFFRQLQNTILLRFKPETIAAAFNALPNNREVRLYVDGDFESVERVAFWMELIDAKPQNRVYGYSKSWAQLLEYSLNGNAWPNNYTLNISSGSKWEDNAQYRAAVNALPITRGDFVAVPIDGNGIPKGSARYKNAEYHKRVRQALREKHGKRVVSCPGNCGDCPVPKGNHWCGDRVKMDKVVIGIGIH